jgi:hypothetical protein
MLVRFGTVAQRSPTPRQRTVRYRIKQQSGHRPEKRVEGGGPVTYTSQDHTGQDFRSLAMGRLENGVAVPAE